MTILRDVLNAFEDADRPLTLNQMAHELSVAPGMLEGMIDYWVRKGKLRETTGAQKCTACSSAKGCHMVVKLPRSYELVNGDIATEVAAPVVNCAACTIPQ